MILFYKQESDLRVNSAVESQVHTAAGKSVCLPYVCMYIYKESPCYFLATSSIHADL